MAKRYMFETFESDSGEFDRNFTDYLNQKRSDNWKVKDCSYGRDMTNQKTVASCIFKQKFINNR